MPGRSAREAAEVVAGELPDSPFLPELPARGPGGDLIGRTGGLLAEVAADLSIEPIPTGWRLTTSSTRTTRLAQSWLREDLDQAEERFAGSAGTFKLQLAGPWTLAASLETASGSLALADPGLVHELSQAMNIVATDHVADVRRRLGTREIILQIDEPSLPAVLAGRIRTASGFGRYEPVSVPEVSTFLRPLAETAGVGQSVLHCCAEYPFDVAGSAGFKAISLDLLGALAHGEHEVDSMIATSIESGVDLFAGLVPAQFPNSRTVEEIAESGWGALDSLWRRTGLETRRLRELVVTPTCGLAGVDWPQARRALESAKEISHRCCNS